MEFDNLDLQTNRENILAAGKQGSGKSGSVAYLVADGLERGFNVLVLDRDRGLAEVIKEVVGESSPSNLYYKLVRKLKDINDGVEWALENLGSDDWLVTEHLGRIWDLAQDEYCQSVFGVSHAERLRVLRNEAENLIAMGDVNEQDAAKIRAKKVAYSGLDGRKDWPQIKSMHNEPFDNMALEGYFNILSTTSVNKIDQESAAQWSDWRSIGVRPEGEKHQVYRHSTVVYTERDGGTFKARTELSGGQGKNRGRELFRDLDFTDVGLVRAIKEHYGEWSD